MIKITTKEYQEREGFSLLKKKTTQGFSVNLMKKERINYLWSKARRISKIIGKLSKISKDIQTYGTKNFSKYPPDISSLGQKFSTRNFIIFPDSKYKLIWNILISFLILYTAIFMPYQICFVNYDQNWLIVDGVIDLLFLIDIILSFFTAYTEMNGKIIVSKKLIRKKYLKSWFFIDLLSCLPVEFLVSADNNVGYNRFARIFRLSRFYKILRLLRMLKLLRVLKISIIESFLKWAKVSPRVTRIVMLLVLIIFSVHVLGCFWYYIGKIEEFSEDTWIHHFSIEQYSDFEKYLASIYYVFTTFTTVGYGDIVPVNNNEKIFAILIMGFGAGMYSYIIGSFTTFVKSRDRIRLEMKEKLSRFKDFSKAINLPRELHEKVTRNIRTNLQVNFHENLDHMKILKDIPSNLRDSVLQYFHQKLIENINFFYAKPTSFLSIVVPRLKLSYFEIKDVVFEKDQNAEEVYFLRSGRISMRALNKVVFRSYSAGSYFGEIEIIENVPRICTALVVSKVSEMFILIKSDFLESLEEFPDIKEEIFYTAKIRKMKHEEGILHVMGLNRDDIDIEDHSLYTDSDFSQISTNERRDEIRKDTGVIIAIQNESKIKRKNRKLWATVLQKDEKNMKFHKTKTMIKREQLQEIRSRSCTLMRSKTESDREKRNRIFRSSSISEGIDQGVITNKSNKKNHQYNEIVVRKLDSSSEMDISLQTFIEKSEENEEITQINSVFMGIKQKYDTFEDRIADLKSSLADNINTAKNFESLFEKLHRNFQNDC